MLLFVKPPCRPYLDTTLDTTYFSSIVRIKGGDVMGKPRPYTKYTVSVKRKVVHGGITKDFERRKQEHKQEWPESIIRKVGGKVTEESARDWEKEKGFS